MSENLPAPSDSRILIYLSDSGETRLEVRLQDETVWLTQEMMAELYQTAKQNMSLHIQNIYQEGELIPEATVKTYLTVRPEGSRTELPVLSGPGTVSREEALEWAQEQYDAFVERRRLEAETEAEARYLEDLRTSAQMLETQRKKPAAPKQDRIRSKRKRRGEDGE